MYVLCVIISIVDEPISNDHASSTSKSWKKYVSVLLICLFLVLLFITWFCILFQEKIILIHFFAIMNPFQSVCAPVPSLAELIDNTDDIRSLKKQVLLTDSGEGGITENF